MNNKKLVDLAFEPYQDLKKADDGFYIYREYEDIISAVSIDIRPSALRMWSLAFPLFEKFNETSLCNPIQICLPNKRIDTTETGNEEAISKIRENINSNWELIESRTMRKKLIEHFAGIENQLHRDPNKRKAFAIVLAKEGFYKEAEVQLTSCVKDALLAPKSVISEGEIDDIKYFLRLFLDDINKFFEMVETSEKSIAGELNWLDNHASRLFVRRVSRRRLPRGT